MISLSFHNKHMILFVVFLLQTTIIIGLNIPNIFINKSNNVLILKTKILELSKKTRRGLIENSYEKEEMRLMFEKLESLNPNKNTLSNPALNAIWNLEYTTSDSILGRGGSERFGPILQTINANELKAENAETVNYFGFLKINRFTITI